MAHRPPLAKFTAALLLGLGALTVTACGEAEAPEPINPEGIAQTDTGIEAAGGFVRRPSPGAPATAAYLDLTAAEGDRLVSARSDAAGTIEIHTMEMTADGVSQMRRIDGLALPAGQTVSLAPGGLHLMMFDPATSLDDAEEIEITLVFEQAGERTVTLPVRSTARR